VVFDDRQARVEYERQMGRARNAAGRENLVGGNALGAPPPAGSLVTTEPLPGDAYRRRP
jgi:hypothetical protein